ncbi:MAG: SCO family protein [Pseudomonadota bacterium]
MRSRLNKALLISSALLVSSVLSGCGGASHTDDGVPPNAIITLSDDFTGDFDLVDQTGAPVTDEDIEGGPAVFYFGFANCPDVCPLSLGTLSAALELLSDEENAKLSPVFVTVDPERDTPEALAEFLSLVDTRIKGLTGSVEAIENAKSGFKMAAEKVPLEESALGYTMTHMSLFYILDDQGTPQIAVHDSVTPAELAAVVRRYL